MTTGDVVVIVPGILGTTLERDGALIWGRWRAVRDLPHFSHRLSERLSLPAEATADPLREVDDGVRPAGLLGSHTLLPGLVSLSGYGKLYQQLVDRLAPHNVEVLTFGYDWRQSCFHAARRLYEWLDEVIGRRRVAVPGARAILVGHSMGGLVAKIAMDRFDRDEIVRRVVSIGSPFGGSMKATKVLTDGKIRVGPLKFDLGALARTWPSVYELAFPVSETHSWLNSADGPSPGASRHREDIFRSLIDGSDRVRPVDELCSLSNIVSCAHPTVGSAADSVPGGWPPGMCAGDGTVSRASAFPLEWKEDGASTFVGGRHSSMQESSAVITQVVGIATSQPRVAQAASSFVGVDAPDCVATGDRIDIVARYSRELAAPPMVAVVRRHNTGEPEAVGSWPLRPESEGLSRVTISLSEPGLYTYEIVAPMGSGRPQPPVSDIILVVGTPRS